MCQAFRRRLIEQGESKPIVNIPSIGGKLFPPNNAEYATSKAGQNALPACLAREMARHKVRVNAICPGLVNALERDDMPRRAERLDEHGEPAKAVALGVEWHDYVASHIPGDGRGSPWTSRA
jgi:NAD(P)-dependent dehydrogenase (short-subunit alcohol dehydrogenase family)